VQATLKPEIQEFIDEQVRSGRFASAADVIEAGVARLMLEPEPLDEQDREAIGRAEAAIARGETFDFGAAAAQLREKYIGK